MVHVLLREVQRGVLTTVHLENQVFEICRKFSLESPIYRFCPGIDPTEYDNMRETIRFDIKSLRRTYEPLCHVESVNCLIWYELGANCRKECQVADSVICPPCIRLKCDLKRQFNRTSNESPSKKVARQQSSSRAPLCHMSPASQEKRRVNQQNDRKNMMKKVLHYAEAEVSLDDEQSDEASSITSILESNHTEEIEKLFNEGKVCI